MNEQSLVANGHGRKEVYGTKNGKNLSIHRMASSLSFSGLLDGRSKWKTKREMYRVKPINSSCQDKEFELYPQSNNDLVIVCNAGSREKSQFGRS